MNSFSTYHLTCFRHFRHSRHFWSCFYPILSSPHYRIQVFCIFLPKNLQNPVSLTYLCTGFQSVVPLQPSGCAVGQGLFFGTVPPTLVGRGGERSEGSKELSLTYKLRDKNLAKF